MTFSPTVSKDCENRENLELLQLTILELADFLNKFDMSARYRLAKLDEKMVSLERSLARVEFTLENTLSSNS